MELNKEITAAIEASLPKQVGETLQKRLAEADRMEEEIKRLKAENDRLKFSNSDLMEKVSKQGEELSKHSELSVRIEGVEKRERNAEIAELKIRLEAADSKTQFARDVALGLVRNVEFRHQAMSSGSVPLMQQNPGGYSTMLTAPSSNTTTTDTKVS